MAKVDVKWVQRFPDRHGVVRHYFRRPGFKRVALPGDPGSAEFASAYQAALSGETAPRRQIGAERTLPGSIAALIIAWYASAEFAGLSPSTQRAYRNQLERFRAKHGDRSAITMRTVHVRAVLDEGRDTPQQTNNLRKRLRQLFQFAVEREWREDNPVLGIRRAKAGARKTEGHVSWSDDDIAKYRAHWSTGTRERLALELALHTGQRRSDLVVMGRQHVSTRRGGRAGEAARISVAQAKGGKRLWIQLHPTLRAEITAGAQARLIFLQTQYGEPFTVAGLGKWFGDSARAAGLQARTLHGLRKACGRILAELGCSTKQIAAILGHESLQEAEKYVRAAEQIVLADSAMDRWVEGNTDA